MTLEATELRSCELTDALPEAISRLTQHMLAVMDLRRKDRLFPADAMVFQTNPLNLAYGACGAVLFLHDALGETPIPIRSWLMAQPIDIAKYPPGLYSGIAGIAWSLAEMGMIGEAVDIFELISQSPLAFAAVDIFNGVAGWGLASLAFHSYTAEERFRLLACTAGDYLLKTVQYDSNGAFWVGGESGDIPLGFAFGASGIALFLLYLWRVTGEPRYCEVARKAIDFDVAHAQVQGDSLRWGGSAKMKGHRPYWLHGGAGVTTALCRFAHIFKDDRYLELARKAAKPCTGFSAAPHLFEGLASMGESLLDMYLLTGDRFYLERSRQKALQILLYCIERPQGVAFPGRYLAKISHDYGFGGAGIGLFLSRVMNLAPRRFHDISSEETTETEMGFSPLKRGLIRNQSY